MSWWDVSFEVRKIKKKKKRLYACHDVFDEDQRGSNPPTRNIMHIKINLKESYMVIIISN